MFVCHKQHVSADGTPIAKEGVHPSVNAARKSACATMLSS
jgi:hypothetical protein